MTLKYGQPVITKMVSTCLEPQTPRADIVRITALLGARTGSWCY